MIIELNTKIGNPTIIFDLSVNFGIWGLIESFERFEI